VKLSYNKSLLAIAVAALSTGSYLPAHAQNNQEDEFVLEEVIVTARRKDESVQDTPLTVNAVNDQVLKDLNITNFSELENVVAGLKLNEDVIDAGATLRGIKYDVLAQAPASVEFYLNDAPASALHVIQKMFDVGQVEVLRGPQGTLRGRASPSGAITVTSKVAELDRFGGYIDSSLSFDGDQNYQGAVNIPLIEDKLALRIAGFWDENDGNGVKSAYGAGSSSFESRGYRISLTAQPTDDLFINAVYQRMDPKREIFTPMETASVDAARSISAKDLKSAQDVAETSDTTLEVTTLSIAWDLNDYAQWNYVGSYQSTNFTRFLPGDLTNAIDEDYSDEYFGAVGRLYTDADGFSHEVRLQSIEPLFDGKISYVVGALYEEGTNTIETESVLYNNALIAGFLGGYTAKPLVTTYGPGQNSDAKGWSLFGNVTYHMSDATEISLGVRKLEYEKDDYIQVELPGVYLSVLRDEVVEEDHEIFTASISHHFTEDVMAYANWGTSWRIGPNLVGVQTAVLNDKLDGFINLPSETSESLELGIKSSWLNNRLQVNAAVYRQEFDNLAFQPAQATYFNDGTDDTPSSYGLDGAVPATVNGLELEINYAASANLTLGALINYAKGEIDNGVIPCNDYSPVDGIPDDVVPTSNAAIDAALGNSVDQVASCTTDQRVNVAPDWSASLTANYDFTVGQLDAYVRGLYSYNHDTDNDPTNPLDDVDAYGILNLYFGVADPEGAWSAMLYAKNVTDTQEVLDREATPAVKNITGIPAFGIPNQAVSSDYREVKLTPQREIGVNFRYNF
jgi:iron complex outermembrane receptor protein